MLARLDDEGEPAVTYDRAPAAGLPARVASVRGELLDLARLASTITDHGVTRIVHAAGMSEPELSIRMPAATVTANAIGTFQLLEAARLTGFTGRIVLLSSTAAHGDGRTPFAATKRFGDQLGQVYVACYGMDVVSLRLSQVYGPGRRLPGLLETLIEAATARRPLPVEADDDAHHFLHVEDVARAVVAALRAPSPEARVYDIVGEPARLAQVIAIVRDRVPHAGIELDGGSAPGYEPVDAAATAADRDLGYRPRWGLARGIDDYCAWREAEEAC